MIDDKNGNYVCMGTALVPLHEGTRRDKGLHNPICSPLFTGQDCLFRTDSLEPI